MNTTDSFGRMNLCSFVSASKFIRFMNCIREPPGFKKYIERVINNANNNGYC